MAKSKGFCVIGLGNFGYTLATTLSALKHQVLVIDESAEKIDQIGDKVTNAVIGDATNESVLRAAGVTGCDCAIICMENNLSDSILITLLLKEIGIDFFCGILSSIDFILSPFHLQIINQKHFLN